MTAFIIQCSRARLPEAIARWKPGRVLSLIDPGAAPPDLPTDIVRLTLRFDDAEDPPGVLPDASHIASLLEFGESWDRASPLLVHCEAGISRSGAGAFILLCQKSPGREAEAASLVRRIAPHLLPNHRMVALADELLGRNGRMVAAAHWPVGMMPEERPPACVFRVADLDADHPIPGNTGRGT